MENAPEEVNVKAKSQNQKRIFKYFNMIKNQVCQYKVAVFRFLECDFVYYTYMKDPPLLTGIQSVICQQSLQNFFFLIRVHF